MCGDREWGEGCCIDITLCNCFRETGYTWLFSALFNKGNIFFDFLFAFLHTKPFKTSVCSEK